MVFEQQGRQADYHQAHYIPALRKRLDYVFDHRTNPDEEVQKQVERNLRVLANELAKIPDAPRIEIPASADLDPRFRDVISDFLTEWAGQARQEFNLATQKKDKAMEILDTYDVDLSQLKNTYHNESLSELVRNITIQEAPMRLSL